MSERPCTVDTVCGSALACLPFVPASSTTSPGRCALSLNMDPWLSWFALSLVVRVCLRGCTGKHIAILNRMCRQAGHSMQYDSRYLVSDLFDGTLPAGIEAPGQELPVPPMVHPKLQELLLARSSGCGFCLTCTPALSSCTHLWREVPCTKLSASTPETR